MQRPIKLETVRILVRGFTVALTFASSACTPNDTDVADTDDGKHDRFGDGVIRTDPKTCPGGRPKLVNGKPAAWTIVHYSAADNNLESNILADINQMEAGHSGNTQVNVIVELDKKSEPGKWIYEITPDADPAAIKSKVLVQSTTEPDTGNWRELAQFGDYAVTCFPAENYFVLPSSHAGGYAIEKDLLEGATPTRFATSDESSKNYMTTPELAQALAHIRAAARRPGDATGLNRIALFGADACVVNTLEVAYTLRHAARFIVSSEDTIPNPGFPYDDILRALTTDLAKYRNDPKALAKMVADKYRDSYAHGSQGYEPDGSLSVVETSKISRVRDLTEKLGELFAGVFEDDELFRSMVVKARSKSFNILDDYTDLATFLRTLREELRLAGPKYRYLATGIGGLLDDALPKSIVATANGDGRTAYGGLSIFLPWNGCGPAIDLDRYRDTPMGHGEWGAFAEAFALAPRPPGNPSENYYSLGTLRASFGDKTYEFPVECGTVAPYLYASTQGVDSLGELQYLWFKQEDDGGHTARFATINKAADGVALSFFAADTADANNNQRPVPVPAGGPLTLEYGRTVSGTMTLPLLDANQQRTDVTFTVSCQPFGGYRCRDRDLPPWQ